MQCTNYYDYYDCDCRCSYDLYIFTQRYVYLGHMATTSPYTF
jgi:hypothetical protein